MKVLFITSTRIGDAVLSTSILNYLKNRFPHCSLYIATGKTAASLFKNFMFKFVHGADLMGTYIFAPCISPFHNRFSVYDTTITSNYCSPPVRYNVFNKSSKMAEFCWWNCFIADTECFPYRC